MQQEHVFHCIHSNFICDSQKLEKTQISQDKQWIQKIWFIYTMKYYSDLKNENILSFAGKWMELENIIMSEVTQTQKDMHISGY